eukprot:CAMPEP_0176104070 /NCGR_PEP_ID=MMETSP0120_2-20121206/52218_1 /TAXON_ID=160619 /ORGANISM="Kryptoperidinium foliaceum, Strain CCMP 1326" /LENGTH=107 /DNA_ID=CAMNT_0017438169 /DNA_START=35 /DNA_END=354 /DNA_ORIENTATION=+
MTSLSKVCARFSARSLRFCNALSAASARKAERGDWAGTAVAASPSDRSAARCCGGAPGETIIKEAAPLGLTSDTQALAPTAVVVARRCRSPICIGEGRLLGSQSALG